MAHQAMLRAPSASEATAAASMADGGGTLWGVALPASSKASSQGREVMIATTAAKARALARAHPDGWRRMRFSKSPIPSYASQDLEVRVAFLLGKALG